MFLVCPHQVSVVLPTDRARGKDIGSFADYRISEKSFSLC